MPAVKTLDIDEVEYAQPVCCLCYGDAYELHAVEVPAQLFSFQCADAAVKILRITAGTY